MSELIERLSHADLIARLEALTGPVADAFERGALAKLAPDIVYDLDSDNLFNLILIGGLPSIGAAVGLVERVLPGWRWAMTTGPGHTAASVRDKSILAHDKIEGAGYHPTPAIALLIATLKALEQQNG